MIPTRTIPPALAPLVAAWEFEPPRRPLRVRDIAELAGVSPEHARVLAHRLVRGGWLHPVARGAYEFVPAASAYPSGSALGALTVLPLPYVLSGLTAARAHGLTPQLASRHLVVLAVDRAVPAALRQNDDFRIVRQRPERVRGAAPTELEGITVRLATLERVVVDAVSHPAWFAGPGEAVRILRRGLPGAEPDRLGDLVGAVGEASLAQRLGWWAERTRSGHLLPPLEEHLRGRPVHRTALVPGRTVRGPTERRWQIVDNLPGSAFADEDAPR